MVFALIIYVIPLLDISNKSGEGPLGQWSLTLQNIMYDTICRKKLVDITLMIINKQRFFNTLHKMFHPKIIGVDIIDLDILQGNMFSLLLYNFYLHKYNENILHLKFELEKGSSRKKQEMKL